MRLFYGLLQFMLCEASFEIRPRKECAKLTPFAAQLGAGELEWDDLWKLNYMVVVEMLQSGEVDDWIKLRLLQLVLVDRPSSCISFTLFL